MPPAQKRQILLGKLLKASPLDDPAAFVLLWTYFTEIGLREVENNFVLRNYIPQTIDPYPLSSNDASYDADRARTWLAKKRNDSDFNSSAIAWLKGLDRLLSAQRGTFEHRLYGGFDDGEYRICAMKNAIAEFFVGVERQPDDELQSHDEQSARKVATAANLSLSLSAYCSRFRVVRAGDVRGRHIEFRRESAWADPSVHDRLYDSRRDLRFLCWPTRSKLVVEPLPQSAPTEESDRRQFVRVTVAAERRLRHEELTHAVAAAEHEGATVLILPELSTTNDDIVHLAELLRERDYRLHPLLTIAGLEHRNDGELDLNEAVVLGPDGEELHRHQKMCRYADDACVEHNRIGESVAILESRIGNVCILICRDLFHPEVQALVESSHATVLFVPSLSPETGPHLDAAKRLMVLNGAATLVSNRWMTEPDAGRNETFSLLPGKSGDGKTTLCKTIPEGADYLLTAVE
jgi:predicted amidohydrolase